jgi:hypothetical protein
MQSSSGLVLAVARNLERRLVVHPLDNERRAASRRRSAATACTRAHQRSARRAGRRSASPATRRAPSARLSPSTATRRATRARRRANQRRHRCRAPTAAPRRAASTRLRPLSHVDAQQTQAEHDKVLESDAYARALRRTMTCHSASAAAPATPHTALAGSITTRLLRTASYAECSHAERSSALHVGHRHHRHHRHHRSSVERGRQRRRARAGRRALSSFLSTELSEIGRLRAQAEPHQAVTKSSL